MTARKSSQNRKSEILAVTLDLAFAVGPDHVTTGMIAKQLGLTQPAIYKHFPNKEDIWRAATETLCSRITENATQDQAETLPPLVRLRQLVLGHLTLVQQVPALPEIMVTRDPSGTLTEARSRIQTAMGGFRATLSRSLEQARTTGQLRAELQSEDGVMLIFGIIQSLVLRLIVSRDPTRLLADGERLLDLQLSLMQNKGNTL